PGHTDQPCRTFPRRPGAKTAGNPRNPRRHMHCSSTILRASYGPPDVPTSRSKAVWSYAAAVLAVAIALAITLYVLPLAERSQLFLLLAAVVLGAWYGGLGPGLLATALAAAGQLAFFEPPYLDDVVRVLLFAAVAGAGAGLAAGQAPARAGGEAAARGARR